MLPGRGTLQVIIGQCIITIVLFRGRGISQAYSSLGKEPRMSVIWSLAEATWCRARKKDPMGPVNTPHANSAVHKKKTHGWIHPQSAHLCSIHIQHEEKCTITTTHELHAPDSTASDDFTITMLSCVNELSAMMTYNVTTATKWTHNTPDRLFGS